MQSSELLRLRLLRVVSSALVLGACGGQIESQTDPERARDPQQGGADQGAGGKTSGTAGASSGIAGGGSGGAEASSGAGGASAHGEAGHAGAVNPVAGASGTAGSGAEGGAAGAGGSEAAAGTAGAGGSGELPASWESYDCYPSAQTPADATQACLSMGDERLNALLAIPFCGILEGPVLVAASEVLEERCCYRIPLCVGGRPLVLEEDLRAAPLRRADAWC